MRLLNSSTPTLRVQQYGKRGGGGDGDDGQWQHRQQKTKHQPPDHLPHTSSYCGQTGRVGALIAWIYPLAKYFERNLVIIPMPTSFTIPGQHWKLGGAPLPHPSTLPDAPSWIKSPWIGLPWIKQSWIGPSWIKQSWIESSWTGQLRSAAASNPYTSLSRRP